MPVNLPGKRITARTIAPLDSSIYRFPEQVAAVIKSELEHHIARAIVDEFPIERSLFGDTATYELNAIVLTDAEYRELVSRGRKR